MSVSRKGRKITSKCIFSPDVTFRISKSKRKKQSPIAQKAPEKRTKKSISNGTFSKEEKEKYMQSAHNFGVTLASNYDIAAASVLFCSSFNQKPCSCLQNFLSNHDARIIRERIEHLVLLMNKAELLRQSKCYDVSTLNSVKSRTGNKGIGLGNGHKKSQEYVNFVLEHRKSLRENMKLCEKATQKILKYSNNFLHKRLKTEPGNTARLSKDKHLEPIEELPSLSCCKKKCVQLAKTHPTLLQTWRDRAAVDQSEARRVIAEMLTPCQGDARNCFQFVVMVTGCSAGTISKVNLHMKESGGSKEPPEHGLKKWWQEQTKKNADKSPQHSIDDFFLPVDQPSSSGLELSNNVVQGPQAVPFNIISFTHSSVSSDPFMNTFPMQFSDDFINSIFLGSSKNQQVAQNQQQ